MRNYTKGNGNVRIGKQPLFVFLHFLPPSLLLHTFPLSSPPLIPSFLLSLTFFLPPSLSFHFGIYSCMYLATVFSYTVYFIGFQMTKNLSQTIITSFLLSQRQAGDAIEADRVKACLCCWQEPSSWQSGIPPTHSTWHSLVSTLPCVQTSQTWAKMTQCKLCCYLYLMFMPHFML